MHSSAKLMFNVKVVNHDVLSIIIIIIFFIVYNHSSSIIFFLCMTVIPLVMRQGVICGAN